jgi:molybdopterin biosynthesis enzyme
VLVLDANSKDDQGGNAVYRERQKFLYANILDKLDPHQFQVHKLIEGKNTLLRVREHLQNQHIAYVTASGHGSVLEYLGWNNEIVISGSTTVLPDDAMIRGKIFHILACSTAFSLGPALISRGAKAFIGYKDKYGITQNGVINSDLAMATVQAATQIDAVLLSGGTVKMAYDAAIQLYKDLQKQMFVNKVSATIQERLEQNRLLLTMFGDPNAKLF